MSRFEDYLAKYAPRLQAEFQSIRARLTDSDVKGSQNEQALTEFLRHHVPSDFIANTAQILDARDQQSDELDIVVCNEYQVFREPTNGLFIAEGVDFVVQVKAQLNTHEIDRIFKNSATVKRLERTSVDGDTARAEGHLGSHLLDHIPYLAFCYTSQLTGDTLYEKLTERSQGDEVRQQPDAMFILDRGLSCYNHGRGDVLSIGGTSKFVGWSVLSTKERTLVEFLRYIYAYIPRIYRVQPPIVRYIDAQSHYRARCRTQ
jgi:uncharacterized protein DUF6602